MPTPPKVKKPKKEAAKAKPLAPSKPATNPFVAQHPPTPGRKATGSAHRGK